MLEYYLVNKNLPELQQSLEKYLRQFIDIKIENYKLPANLPTNEPDFNQYFLNEIEPKLPRNSAVFVTGYPAFLSPLAKGQIGDVDNFLRALNVGNPHSPRNKKISTSQRFELYINGIEIANGCEENTNAESIKSAFEVEKNYRLQNNLPLHPYSTDFIDNCSILSPCSGVGIGIERLLMIINQKNNI
jgi:lysyl-tRNA synthetase class 2